MAIETAPSPVACPRRKQQRLVLDGGGRAADRAHQAFYQAIAGGFSVDGGMNHASRRIDGYFRRTRSDGICLAKGAAYFVDLKDDDRSITGHDERVA